MADHDHNHHHHHHHQHRPHRLSLPQRPTTPTTFAATPTAFPTTPTTSRQYPVYPFSSSSTPIATPSKHRLSSLNPKPFNPNNNSKSSLSFLFFLLLSLRSLYSLLPFLRSSPSFSLFPFSFLHRLLVAKSILLAVVFLLRFQALRYCGTAAMILAELSGNVAARFLAEGRDSNLGGDRNRSSKVRGFLALFSGLLLLSLSWDRIECFPFSAKSVESLGLSVFPRVDCVRIWPMLLPFLSGFLGCYERVSMNWGTIRQLGRKRVRLISLFFTTVVLFIPAVVSVFMFEAEGDGVSIGNLAWPLANTVVFGVLLSESYGDDKSVSSKNFRKEYLVTFLCTLVLELFYFPELSLWGLLLCGLLLYVAVRELDPYYSNYLELGMESSESFTTAIMKPIRHILSERKSRKIALFLLINTAYMFVEFAAGFMSNSLGLISDACHMLFDCAALAIGLYASYISLLESFERILDPQEISTSSLLVVSIGGLLVNVVGLVFFHEEHHHAHGGSGSCSHSHHHQHSHDSVGHDHGGHGKHEESIPISIECRENSCSGHDDHHEHQHGSYIGSKDHNFGSNECHDHDGHSHQHDHHGQSHQHDHHGQSHQHDQHDHDRQHEHHNHACQHKHHDHAHQHDQHDHDRQHEHHDHACQHKHHDHAHQHTHSSEGNKVAESHIQGAGFQQKKLPTDGEKTAKHQHHHIDHNMEGIFLHVLADTLGSVGVVISTLLIKYKGWLVADPACSIFISVLIISSVIPLLRNSAEILLQRVPRAHEQDLRKALVDVRKIRGISGIQNLHIWSFTNSEVVGTLHLHVSTDIDKASAKAQVSHVLYEAGIKDLTLQLECVEQ
ncbi:putative zinc transporter protein [Prunus yedoensis var. nudiflora]|uniref:Putative zinc transporter protein n=1 Tax=Prunus yedoensis var. nudiflora TaxID=2094558 RepID=A0A314YXW3_PRUYE|nr:putative zinc transporter protein [Prunus yedoensis var. nudiflora]